MKKRSKIFHLFGLFLIKKEQIVHLRSNKMPLIKWHFINLFDLFLLRKIHHVIVNIFFSN